MNASHRSGGEPPAPGEVQVWFAWLADLRSRQQALSKMLAPAELATAARFVREADRVRSIGARGLLRAVIASCLDAAPRDLDVVTGPFGKPELASAGRQMPSFSVSHSGELVVLAVAGPDADVGVDVEHRRALPDWTQLAARHFHPQEVAELLDLPPTLGHAAFFDCWTRKEAVAKACGRGLSLPLASFRVSIGTPHEARLLDATGLPVAAAPWALVPLMLADGYAAALAVTGLPPHRVSHAQFDTDDRRWQRVLRA
jgi:4'-phosphopantetheinyl transferase